LNYFAPAFRVEVSGTRLEADVSMNIEQVQVVSKPDSIDAFSFTIANALPKLRWTHTTDGDLFAQAKSVKISMGYEDKLTEMIEGEITQINPSFPDGGTPTLAIEGHSLMHRLQGTNRTRTFQQVTDKQIVDQLARDAGLQAKVEDTNTQYQYVMQANQTDLDFLRERAKRLHYEILVQNKTLLFRKSQESEEDKNYTLVWAAMPKSNLDGSKTLPLKSCSLQMNTLAPPTKVQVRGYDVKNKKAFVSHADSSDQTSKMKGKQTGADVAACFQREREHIQVATPIQSQQEGDDSAKGHLNNKSMDLISANVATLGTPDLRSGQIIELRGIGLRFDGNYRIEEATHSISSSGYSTSLSLKRNSVS
jgi:phage protein D